MLLYSRKFQSFFKGFHLIKSGPSWVMFLLMNSKSTNYLGPLFHLQSPLIFTIWCNLITEWHHHTHSAPPLYTHSRGEKYIVYQVVGIWRMLYNSTYHSLPFQPQVIHLCMQNAFILFQIPYHNITLIIIFWDIIYIR